MTGIPARMRAMVLQEQNQSLQLQDVPVPVPNDDQVLLRVHACGVCRTVLHILDAELNHPKLTLIPGHEIIGTVVQQGGNVTRFQQGDRIGVPWLGYTCGECRYCEKGRENLCDNAGFTGYTLDGGYAEYTVADQRYCFPVPPQYEHAEATPLLCAGLIGYRSYRMTGDDNQNLGIYGFGAAAHILAQVAVHQGKNIYAFTKPGDTASQAFAKRFVAVWAGGSDEEPPVTLDAAIIFTPVGSLVPAALRATDKGGTIVCGGIHMSDIPSFPYSILWEERVVRSVANLQRIDGQQFMKVAPDADVRTEMQRYTLTDANQALADLRNGRLKGAAVLSIAG